MLCLISVALDPLLLSLCFDAQAQGLLRLSPNVWARLEEITAHQMSQRHNDPALHWELGKLMLELGMAETGKNWLLSALRLDAHYVPALMALADYYEKQGDAALAAEYRRQAQQDADQQALVPKQ